MILAAVAGSGGEVGGGGSGVSGSDCGRIGVGGHESGDCQVQFYRLCVNHEILSLMRSEFF